jgi:hypothetical protein
VRSGFSKIIRIVVADLGLTSYWDRPLELHSVLWVDIHFKSVRLSIGIYLSVMIVDHEMRSSHFS